LELDIIRAIQSIHCGFLDLLFQGITIMAEQYFLIVVMLAVYWIFDKDCGEYMIYSMLTGMTLNNGIKNIFKLPRPIGEEGVRTLRAETATGHSFPSGHSQTSASASWSLAISKKKKWLYIVAVIYPLLVGVSRLYLGVHYPKDVVVGLALGIGVSYLCFWLYKKVRNRVLLYFLSFAATLPFLFAGVSKDFVKSSGMYLGFAVAMFIDKKFLHYEFDVPMPKRILRFVLGLVFTGIVYLPMKLLFPDEFIFAFLRYFILIVMVLGVYPITFKWIK